MMELRAERSPNWQLGLLFLLASGGGHFAGRHLGDIAGALVDATRSGSAKGALHPAQRSVPAPELEPMAARALRALDVRVHPLRP